MSNDTDMYAWDGDFMEVPDDFLVASGNWAEPRTRSSNVHVFVLMREDVEDVMDAPLRDEQWLQLRGDIVLFLQEYLTDHFDLGQMDAFHGKVHASGGD